MTAFATKYKGFAGKVKGLMHELPAVLSMLEMMEQKARENHLKKVTRIDLRIGELSDLVDDCIQLYFDTASEGTVCEGAVLHFEREPAQLRCLSCGHVFPHVKSFDCPVCGGRATLVRGTGSGFVIERFTGEA